MFASLAIRNYRIYFTGGLFANIGQWIARTAQSWLVLMVLTDQSASALGYVNALAFVPQLVLGAWAGTVADRFRKRTIMLTTQSIMCVNATILAVLVLSGYAQLWHVYVLAFMDGMAMCFDNPARQAFVSEMVPPEQLTNAISLNSASFNTARLVGPGVAGVLIAALGTGPVLVVNVAAYLVMIFALAKLQVDQLRLSKPATGKGKVREGLRYIQGRIDLVILLTCAFALGGLGFNFNISNAIMATQEFGKDAGEYGLLGSVMGVGALSAALLAATRKRARFRYVLIGMAGYVFFSFWAATAPNFATFAILQAPIGLFLITGLVTANSMVQGGTSPTMRGRVMAIWGLLIMGAAPIVSPIVGWMGDHLGPRSTVWFGAVGVGIFLVVVMVIFVRNDGLRMRLTWSGIAPKVQLYHSELSEEITSTPRYT